MKTFFIKLLLFLWLPSCIPATSVPLPTPSAMLTPSPTPSPTMTPTLVFTSTPRPPILVTYYHLRLEYTTTSDWTSLEFKDAESTLLSLRLVEKQGSPTIAQAHIRQLDLTQPLEQAQQGQTVGMVVDYALLPEAIEQPLSLLLRKGDLGNSVVRLYALVGEQPTLLDEVVHRGVVAGSGGLNPRSIEINLGLLQSSAPLQAQIQRTAPKMLWAFYYPWYSLTDWSSAFLADHPLVPYASNDEQAMQRQIEQAQGAGIDGFISSWWGPGSYTDDNLGILLRLAQQSNFAVSIIFETLKDNGPRSVEEIYRWLVYLLDQHGDHPAFFKVDGKPMIVVWASGTVPLDSWQQIFTRLRQQGRDAFFVGMGYDLANLEVFAGLHEYAIFAIPNLAEMYRSVGQAVHTFGLLGYAPNPPKLWVATVQPGYDDRLLPGREGLFQDRLDGQFYRDTFEAALGSDPDWIFITSWNEWWENTHIEPSKLYGELYLQLTREFAERWKNSQ